MITIKDPAIRHIRSESLPSLSFLGYVLTCIFSVVRFLVASFLLPFTLSSPERTIRVAGGRQTWQQLIDILGDIQGVTYDVKYLSADAAVEKERAAFVVGDTDTQLAWSARPLAASGLSDVEPLDNNLFDFVLETPRQTFEKFFGGKK